MKILIANTFHYFRGGDCTYTFALATLLRAHGHEVRFFGMHHPLNLECPDSAYWVDYVDFVEMNQRRNLVNGIKVVSRSIYSRQARERIARMLDDVQPDVVHLQNIHTHITPSIIEEISRRSVPVLWTLHDFKLICPNTHLLSHGKICEACKGGKFINCTIRKCKKGSTAASLVATLEATAHRALGMTNKVHTFISPSQFLVDKFVDFGEERSRFLHLRNFLDVPPRPDTAVRDNGTFVYLGQLQPWKGVGTLIDAARGLRQAHVEIFGDGPDRAELESRAGTNSTVVFHGQQPHAEAGRRLAESAALVLPSECYENCPYSVMEAMALGKPVIGARIGGIPELVSDRETGLLFEPGNAQELAACMRELASDPALRRRMGDAARAKARQMFDPGRYYDAVAALYDRARAGADRTQH